MPYNRQIPDAPAGLSMLPRIAAADLKKNDLLTTNESFETN